MKYKIEDNHLLIYDDDDELIEDATENMTECEYCIHELETCDASGPSSKVRQYGGQFCDSMKCMYEEIEGE